MGSQRRAQSAGVVGVVEVVDPVRVVAERRVLACRRQRQWRAAAPAAAELRHEEFPLLLGAGGLVQEPVEGCDVGVVLAEDDVGAVAAEDVGGRHGQGRPVSLG